MSRPAHIAPLDEALAAKRVEWSRASAEAARLTEEHAQALSAVASATKAVDQARHDIVVIEEAIGELGYVVLRADLNAVSA